MYATDAEIHQYLAGFYICSRMRKELDLYMDVPRQNVMWPVHITCRACGEEHTLHYNDVREPYPAFGHE